MVHGNLAEMAHYATYLWKIRQDKKVKSDTFVEERTGKDGGEKWIQHKAEKKVPMERGADEILGGSIQTLGG